MCIRQVEAHPLTVFSTLYWTCGNNQIHNLPETFIPLDFISFIRLRTSCLITCWLMEWYKRHWTGTAYGLIFHCSLLIVTKMWSRRTLMSWQITSEGRQGCSYVVSSMSNIISDHVSLDHWWLEWQHWWWQSAVGRCQPVVSILQPPPSLKDLFSLDWTFSQYFFSASISSKLRCITRWDNVDNRVYFRVMLKRGQIQIWGGGGGNPI